MSCIQFTENPFQAMKGYGHTSAARKRRIAERNFLDSDHKPSFTPLSFIRLMADQGFVFDMVVSTMEVEATNEFYQRRWRVEFIEAREGVLRGVGEAARKLLAKEAAAMDLLENVKREYPHMDLPKVKMQKGPKISPSLINKLSNLALGRELGHPIYSTRLESDKRSDEVYKTTVTIGDREYTDKCRDQFYSKLQAALVAYNDLADKPFPLYGHYSGKDCHRQKSANKLYGGVEVEQLHIVNSIINANAIRKLQKYRTEATEPGPSLTKIRLAREQRRMARSSNSLAETTWTENPYTVISSSSLATRAASVHSVQHETPAKKPKTVENMRSWASCTIIRPQDELGITFAKFGSSSSFVNTNESDSDDTLVGSSDDERVQKDRRIATIRKKRFMRTRSSTTFLNSD